MLLRLSKLCEEVYKIGIVQVPLDGWKRGKRGRDIKKHCIIDVYGHDANEMNVFPLELTNHIPFSSSHLIHSNKKAPAS